MRFSQSVYNLRPTSDGLLFQHELVAGSPHPDNPVKNAAELSRCLLNGIVHTVELGHASSAGSFLEHSRTCIENLVLDLLSERLAIILLDLLKPRHIVDRERPRVLLIISTLFCTSTLF